MTINVIHADSREALRDIPDASVDSCVCDPPYALVSIAKRLGNATQEDLDKNFIRRRVSGQAGSPYAKAASGFMGKKWDTGETAFDPAFWVEVLRVLKPGAHLVAFGGTRTFHRLVCAIEDAGFEIRDQLAWLFGSGFPKSHDVSKGIDRAVGAEREIVGVADSRGRDGANRAVVVSTSEGYGFATKGGIEVTAPATEAARQWQGWGTALKPAHEPICLARKPLIGTVAANVLQHGTGALNIDASRVAVDPEADASQLRTMSRSQREGGDGWGMSTVSGDTPQVVRAEGRWPANVIHDGSEEVLRGFPESDAVSMRENGSSTPNAYFGGASYEVGARGFLDSGSAARFFYTAKADAEDRLGSKHPTVKPVDLMAYLIKLVTPPGGLVLDPFAGSGTTGMACMREGFRAVLIEREVEYVEDIKRRLAHVKGEDAPLFAGVAR